MKSNGSFANPPAINIKLQFIKLEKHKTEQNKNWTKFQPIFYIFNFNLVRRDSWFISKFSLIITKRAFFERWCLIYFFWNIKGYILGKINTNYWVKFWKKKKILCFGLLTIYYLKFLVIRKWKKKSGDMAKILFHFKFDYNRFTHLGK